MLMGPIGRAFCVGTAAVALLLLAGGCSTRNDADGSPSARMAPMQDCTRSQSPTVGYLVRLRPANPSATATAATPNAPADSATPTALPDEPTANPVATATVSPDASPELVKASKAADVAGLKKPHVKATFLTGIPSATDTALGLVRLYVADSSDPADLPADVEDVRALTLRATDSELRTCVPDLSDKPKAVALRDAALKYMMSNGLVSSDQLNQKDTISLHWYITDNVPADGQVAVFLVLQTMVPFGQKMVKPEAVMTVFAGKNGAILGASQVDLFAAEGYDQ